MAAESRSLRHNIANLLQNKTSVYWTNSECTCFTVLYSLLPFCAYWTWPRCRSQYSVCQIIFDLSQNEYLISATKINFMQWATWTVPNVTTWTIIIVRFQWVFLLIVSVCVSVCIYICIYEYCKGCFYVFPNDQPWQWVKMWDGSSLTWPACHDVAESPSSTQWKTSYISVLVPVYEPTRSEWAVYEKETVTPISPYPFHSDTTPVKSMKWVEDQECPWTL